MRNTMYKYGVLVTNFLLVSVTVGDPDTFPTDGCAFVNCQQNSTNHKCCSNSNPEPTGSDDISIETNTAAIFFAAVIGSLVAVILMMFFCMNCEKMCNRLYKKKASNADPRSTINTVSAEVQTNSINDVPPPYTYRDFYCPCNTVESGGTVEFHIPRCPSYVKDPPNYLEVIDESETQLTTENEINSNDTDIELSVNSSAVA